MTAFISLALVGAIFVSFLTALVTAASYVANLKHKQDIKQKVAARLKEACDS